MYDTDYNSAENNRCSVYTAIARRQPIDEFVNPLPNIIGKGTQIVKTLANATPEDWQRVRSRIGSDVAAARNTTAQNLNNLGKATVNGIKNVTTTVGNTASDLSSHIAGTTTNAGIDTAKDTAKIVFDKNGKTVAGIGAAALGLYGAHNIVQHMRKNAESDRAIRRQLDANKELFRYKASVRQEMLERERALRNMTKEEIAAAKDRERKELLKLQSLEHQADVEGRNMQVTGYNPYIKESAIGDAINKFKAPVQAVEGKEYTDKDGNKKRQVTIGDKTYTQADGSDVLTPVKEGGAKVTRDDAIKAATHERNVKRASTALSVGVPVALVTAGAIKHHMDEKKKRKEEEDRRRKEEEDAYNARIDVRVRKALSGKKKQTNESVGAYSHVAINRYGPPESLGTILEDAIRVRIDYDNNHRNFGMIAEEYVPATAASPWLSQGG